MSIRRFGFILLGIFFLKNSFSQENYQQGYLIDIRNDTIHGLIDYRDWGKNPNSVSFKDKIDGEVKTYTPIDIIEFSVQDEIYVGAIVNTEISPSRTDNLEHNPALKIRIDTIFLLTLYQGDKCLYYYKSKEGKVNYYIKRNSEYELLVHKKYLKTKDGKPVIAENKKYLGQLTLYFSDCISIQSKLVNTKYNQRSLEKLFQFYYKCSQSNITYQKKQDKVSSEIGVLAGGSLSYLNFKGDAFAYLVNADFSPSYNLATGMFYDIILTRNQKKWSVNNELLYTSYKIKGQYKDIENENSYLITTTEIGYSYLKINNLVRFKYPIGNLYVYLNGGISNGFVIAGTNHKIEELKFYSVENTSKAQALNDIRKHEQGYIIGLGTKLNKLSFEMRYEKANGMSKYIILNSLTKRYYFLLGYRF